MVYLGNLSDYQGTLSKIGRVVYDVAAVSSEDIAKGIIVDSVPEPQPPDGYRPAGMYVDTNTKVVTYTYEKTENKIISDLQTQNAQMILALVKGGLL